jgi:hypothetical protein
MEELILGGEEYPLTSKLSGAKFDYTQAVLTEKVSRLEIGDWMEFTNENGKTWRGKLSRRIQSSSICVFVNRSGIKVFEVETHELVSRMRKGMARIIEDSDTSPLVSALSILIHFLKNLFTKTEESLQSVS